MLSLLVCSSDVTCCAKEGPSYGRDSQQDMIVGMGLQPVPVGRCTVGLTGLFLGGYVLSSRAGSSASSGAGGLSAPLGLFDAYCQTSWGADKCDDSPVCGGMSLSATGSARIAIVATRKQLQPLPEAADCLTSDSNILGCDPEISETRPPWCDAIVGPARRANSSARDQQQRWPSSVPSSIANTLNRLLSAHPTARRGAAGKVITTPSTEEMVYVGPATLYSGPMSVSSRHRKMPFEDGWFEHLSPILYCDASYPNCAVAIGDTRVPSDCGCYDNGGFVGLPGWSQVPISEIKSLDIPIVDVDRTYRLKFFKDDKEHYAA